MLNALKAPAGQAPPRWMVWLLVSVTTVVQAMAAFAVLTLPALAPEVAAALNVAPSLIGYQVAVVYAGAILSSMFAGSQVRRWGACRTSQISMLVSGGGCFLMAIESLPIMVVGSFLVGVAYGQTNPAASHLLARVAAGRHRNLIFSIKQTGVPLGGILAGLVAPPIALAFGWQWAMATVGVVSFIVAAAMQGLREPWDTDRDPKYGLVERPLDGLVLVWSVPAIRWISSAGFCFSMIQLCLMTFLVTLLVEEVDFTLIEAGFLLSAVHAAGVGGRIAWGWVADRMQSGFVLLSTLGLMSLTAAAITSTLSPQWPLMAVEILFVLFGFSAIGWNGIYLAELARLSPAGQVGTATGGALSVTFSGVLLGPAVFAAAYTWIGSYSGTFALLIVVAAGGAASAALAGMAARRPARPTNRAA